MSVQPGEGDKTRAVDQEDDPQLASATGGVAWTGDPAVAGGTDQQQATEAAPGAAPGVLAGAGTAGTAAVVPPDQQGRKDPRGGRTRRIVVGVLVFIFAVLLPL